MTLRWSSLPKTSPARAHTHTHSLTHSLTHYSLTHSLTHPSTQLTVDRSQPKDFDGTAPEYRTAEIFVGGLPPNATEDDLGNYFSQWGPVCVRVGGWVFLCVCVWGGGCVRECVCVCVCMCVFVAVGGVAMSLLPPT